MGASVVATRGAFHLDESSLEGVEPNSTKVITEKESHSINGGTLFICSFTDNWNGDPEGSRTPDLQDENLTSWTTRRRGRWRRLLL